jgi:hypothetical protein
MPALRWIIAMNHYLTLEEALAGKEIPHHIRENLVLVDVEYRSFDECEYTGQLVIHRELAEEMKAIFAEIKAAHFPIEKIIPVAAYDWSDDASMEDNNSSAFNYRNIVGGENLSQHAYGRAIDINPCQNPYVKGDIVLPQNAFYSPDAPGTIVSGDAVVEAFVKRGWDWGGNWQRLKDWQHFEKRDLLI